MKNNHDPYFSYEIDALSFLERAEEQLRLFDAEENISNLLYAALELRMGIESRLYEIINAHTEEEKSGQSFKKEFSASKLRKKLVAINVDADDEQVVNITINNEDSLSFRYTPVTKKLVAMHGSLGNLLHYTLFESVDEWYVKDYTCKGSQYSLGQYRVYLNEVKQELSDCSCGDIIRPIARRKA